MPACCSVESCAITAVDPSPAYHYTAWDYAGSFLLLSGAVFAYLCYRIGFKVKAKCMVIGSTTQRACKKDGKVILGCHHHRWQKPVAWIRRLGAAARLDPWLYRLHITPPSFAPMTAPVQQTLAAGPAESAPSFDSKMTRDAWIAVWSLILALIQAVTGIVALFS